MTDNETNMKIEQKAVATPKDSIGSSGSHTPYLFFQL